MVKPHQGFVLFVNSTCKKQEQKKKKKLKKTRIMIHPLITFTYRELFFFLKP